MTTRFVPDAENDRAYRNALGQFATGVTVITTPTPDGPIGMTANSFASVSLDPPLVLWSPAKSSRRFPFFEAATHFSIHVLDAEQQDICLQIAMDGRDFDDIRLGQSETGVPVIQGCLARFDCTTYAQHEGGDHLIIVGRVDAVETRPGTPLLFAGGAYGRFTPSA
ncbi:MAG: flavin reductase family protein [Pseudomonadota bacterium]